MELSRDSEAGKAQLADPDKNVFTGYEFGADLNEEAQKEAEQRGTGCNERDGNRRYDRGSAV